MDFFDQMDEARIAELEKKISEARKSYFNGVATVSDELYDAWMDELEELKKDSPQVLAVGAPVSEAWPKTRHVIPMGSLGKINSLEELTSWVHEVSRPPTKEIPYEELIVTDKLDGLSTSITYVEGVLTQGVTRGDGLVGSDVTPNIARIPDVPNKLPKPLDLTLRAEIVLYRGVFEERFQSNYKNTRNAASGIIQRLDGRGCEHLSVRFFEVAEGFDCEKRSDQFEFMDQLGLPIPNWYVTAMVPGAKTPHDLWVEYQQTVREQLPYDIDGLVVEVNDLGYLLELGIGSDNRPKGARAFKFSAVTRETVAVRRIDQVGGTGRITPVAEFRPVRLLGAEVSRASLYNQDYIKQIGFDVGAKILVARANDVIPRVVSVLQPTGTISKPPTHCPECGTPTEWDGKFLICPNIYECPAQTEGRIKQWIRELNILGWGDVLIERLVSEKLVTSVPDLYKLSREQIASLDRMGTTSAENVLRTLWEVVPMPLEQFLGALSIPFCATTTVRIIVDAGFDSLAKIQEASEQDLQQIAGVGPRRASAICGWLRRHEDLLSDLQEAGVKIKDRPVGVLTGKSICFTGKMAYKRAEMERMAQEQGASVKNTVGKGLTLLVVGDNVGQKKIAAAQKHKTQTLTVEEFLQLIGG